MIDTEKCVKCEKLVIDKRTGVFRCGLLFDKQCREIIACPIKDFHIRTTSQEFYDYMWEMASQYKKTHDMQNVYERVL